MSGIWGSMKNKNISIALCTYNGERFLREQLDSILKQTYQNFEIIIVDDCSSDFTIRIINEYMEKYENIYLYQNKTNLGFIKNFEKAISLCSGNFICLADQDDIWLEQKLELFLKEIKNNVLIYSDAILIDEFSNKTNEMLIHPKNLVSGNNNKAFLLDNCLSGNTLMFKKELLKYILPIPNEISFHDIWIGFVATTYGTITYTPTAMTLYRRYSEQVTFVRKKEHKNFIDRLKHKRISKIENSIKQLKNMNAFISLDILKEKEIREIIIELIHHYKNYENIFYNFSLSNILNKHKEKIFYIQNPKKRNKLIFKFSSGLKIQTYTLFVL